MQHSNTQNFMREEGGYNFLGTHFGGGGAGFLGC